MLFGKRPLLGYKRGSRNNFPCATIKIAKQQQHRPTMPSPTGSTAIGSRSSSSLKQSSYKTTTKPGRGAINKWSSDPDLPPSSSWRTHHRVRVQLPHSHTGAAPSSYVDAATRHLSNQIEATFTSDLDSTLLNLPLYDGELYEKYGHESVACLFGGRAI